jgi:hypothetical protein
MLPRLRVQWHGFQSLLIRQANAFQETVNQTAVTSRERWDRLAGWFTSRTNFRHRALKRQYAHLLQFMERYEDMVDLLCWAAREGVQPKMTDRYADLRIHLRRLYRPVRTRLRRHWQQPDVKVDPFASLFMPADIEEVINADAGTETMMVARMALSTCQSELEAILKQ